MDIKRTDRISELIKREISTLLTLEKIKDPRIKFVSITAVEVSKDMKTAKVFVSIYGDETEKKSSIAGLNSARGFIKREIGTNLKLRYTPDIHFLVDESLERGNRINEILRGLEK